jgi:uncharacterized protein YndB with AHSA1/START domain
MNMQSVPNGVLQLERRFEAPRDIVFALWTQPGHIVNWWGPRGHSLDHCEQDFREGGRWRFCIRNAGNGDRTWTWGIYREIITPEKLVFSYSMDWHRYETLVTLTFEDLGGATLVRVHQAEFLNPDDVADHSWGWMSTIDKFGEYLTEIMAANLMRSELHDAKYRNGVAEDIAAAAERAAREQKERPGDVMPPSVEAGKTGELPPGH